MNENVAQQFDTSLFSRYASNVFNVLDRSRRHTIVSRLSSENEPVDFSSLFGNDFMIHGKSMTKRQTQTPYEVIYLSPEKSNQATVYEAPNLDQVRAIYPYRFGNSVNTSCVPKTVCPVNSLPNSNPTQYVIYPTSVQRPQTYQVPASTKQQVPLKPVVKSSPIVATQPQICPTTSAPINNSPKICHCPIIPAPPPTKKPCLASPNVAMPTTTAPIPLSTTIISLPFPPPTLTTTECTTVPTTTVAPVPKTPISPISTPLGANSTDKRCAFCVKNAFIFLGFKPQNIAAIKDLLKNVEEKDNFSQFDGVELENSNEPNLKENFGFDIEKAILNVDKDSTDQSKLIKVIEELIQELRKPKKDYDFTDDDDEKIDLGNHPVDYDDYVDDDESECNTESDLLEAANNLCSTISTYQKKK